MIASQGGAREPLDTRPQGKAGGAGQLLLVTSGQAKGLERAVKERSLSVTAKRECVERPLDPAAEQFAIDSMMEVDGFKLPVPGFVKPRYHLPPPVSPPRGACLGVNSVDDDPAVGRIKKQEPG